MGIVNTSNSSILINFYGARQCGDVIRNLFRLACFLFFFFNNRLSYVVELRSLTTSGCRILFYSIDTNLSQTT